MTIGPTPLCLRCRHFEPDRHPTPFGWYCKAFQNRPIPEEIVRAEVVHDHPVKGDHGLQFEAAEPVVTTKSGRTMRRIGGKWQFVD